MACFFQESEHLKEEAMRCLIILKSLHVGRYHQWTIIVSHPSWVPFLHFLQSMGRQYFVSDIPHFFSLLGLSSLFLSLYTLGLCFFLWLSEWYKALFKPVLHPVLPWLFSDTSLSYTRKARLTHILSPLTIIPAYQWWSYSTKWQQF